MVVTHSQSSVCFLVTKYDDIAHFVRLSNKKVPQNTEQLLQSIIPTLCQPYIFICLGIWWEKSTDLNSVGGVQNEITQFYVGGTDNIGSRTVS